MIRSLATGVLLALALQAVAAAGEGASDAPPEQAEPPAPQVPVEIEADQIQSKNNDFTFAGNVVVSRGKTHLTCDRMDGSLEEVEVVDPATQEKTRQKRIVLLVAQGRVNVTDQASGRRGTCEKAVYDVQLDQIVLTGTADRRPRVWDGEAITEADKIIFLLKENRVVWENASGRPVKFILPGGTVEGKKPKDNPAPPPD